MFQPADGFFLDLSYPFTGKVEALANFLEGERVFAAKLEVQPYNFDFAAVDYFNNPYR